MNYDKKKTKTADQQYIIIARINRQGLSDRRQANPHGSNIS